MYIIDNFAMMEPMKYYNNETVSVKRQEMINDKNNEYVATEKRDGDWSMCIHYCKGKNLIRSRSISKVTGVYGDYTAKVPHLCAEMDNWPDNTVVLAELCFNEYGTNANTVGTILRCLPAKAVERQKKTPLCGFIFDVLMYEGKDLTNSPYFDRISYYGSLLRVGNNIFDAKYFYRTTIFSDGIDFQEAADEIISAGGEGIVIQRKDNPYMPGTRTAWKTLKLKQTMPEMELQVLETLEPNKYYEGDFPEKWQYVELSSGKLIDKTIDVYCPGAGAKPVTKPYFYGWKNGIRVKYNNTITDVTSGLTDLDREWLATQEAQDMIKNGELFAVVKAMMTNDLGKLRHPYLIRLRNDL